MRRGRSNRLFVIVIVILLVAVVFVGAIVLMSSSNNNNAASSVPTATVVSQPGDTSPPNVPATQTPVTAKIVIAANDLSIGTTLNQQNIMIVDVPSSEAQASDTVQGKDVGMLYGKLNTIPLFKGQRIHARDVIDGPFSNLMAYLVKQNRLEPGRKAMAFPVDDLQAVGQLLSDGDLVDAVATYRFAVPADPPYFVIPPFVNGTPQPPLLIQPTAPAPELSVKTILQNIRVLKVIPLGSAFGIQPDTPVPPTPIPGTATVAPANGPATPEGATGAKVSDKFAPNGSGFPVNAILILGVTDQEAEVLKFTQETGGSLPVIHFVLRSRPTRPNDLNDPSLLREETRGSTYRIMVTNYAVPVPELIRVK